METEQYKRARELVGRVMKNPHSTFYKQHLGDTGEHVADGTKEWERLSKLSRSDIQSTRFSKRIYTPFEEIGSLRVTSGTSGAGVMILPRMGHEKDARSSFYDEYITRLNPVRLATFSGAQFLYAALFRHNYGIDSLFLDGGEMRVSAALIQQYKPDMLAGFVYAINALLPHISKDITHNIKAVQLFGEWCSTLQWEELKKRFPNALLVSEYASIESQSVLAIPCREMMQKKERYVHPVPEYALVEIIDPETGEKKTRAGERGEMVVTVLRPVAFPLIRYKTGDLARIVDMECSCGVATPLLAVEGRLNIDRIRVSGGEINITEADRAIVQISHIADPEFEIRYSEVTGEGGRIQVHITIALRFDKQVTSAEMLSKELMHILRVSPHMTYADGVARGLYVPLSVVQLEKISGVGKRKRIIRDVT